MRHEQHRFDDDMHHDRMRRDFGDDRWNGAAFGPTGMPGDRRYVENRSFGERSPRRDDDRRGMSSDMRSPGIYGTEDYDRERAQAMKGDMRTRYGDDGGEQARGGGAGRFDFGHADRRFSRDDVDRRVPRDETDRLISAHKVEGTPVYDRSGDKIGEIDTLMIEKRAGEIEYALVRCGGGLFGTNDDYRPVEWNRLSYDERVNGYCLR